MNRNTPNAPITKRLRGLDPLSSLCRAWQSARRGCRLILMLLVLSACVSCTLLGLLVRRTLAREPTVDVVLAIDNSYSMFPISGVGSDPELRRIDAAHMFINYLGLDTRATAHRLGVVSFGGEAELVAPLTPLGSDYQRAEMISLIAEPEPIPWTDPAAALTLSREVLLNSSEPGRQPMVVLLTDGKPEWDSNPTHAERQVVIDELKRIGQLYAQEGIELFVILLANEATDADPEIATLYVPLWKNLTEATGGSFHTIRRADDLFTVYHEILLTLSPAESAGPVVNTLLDGTPQNATLLIEQDLARVIYLVHSTTPDVTIAIYRPSGDALQPDDTDVHYAGEGSTVIWVVPSPQPGEWEVRMAGHGEVTIWKDFLPIHKQEERTAPPPTPLPPSPSPAPQLVVGDWPQTAVVGNPIRVSAWLEPQPLHKPTYRGTWHLDNTESGTAQMLDNGRPRTLIITPTAPGTLFLKLWSEVEGHEIASWEGHVTVEPHPQLILTAPDEGAVWRVDEPVSIDAHWSPTTESFGTSDPVTITLCPVDGTECDTLTGTVGHPIQAYAPSIPGDYTLVIDAPLDIPGAPMRVETVTRTVVVGSPPPTWLWLSVVGFLATVAGGWWVYRYQQGLPRVAGRLRVLSSPAAYAGPTLTDLSTFNRRSLELGGAGTALELPADASPWATVRALRDGSGMELSPCNGGQIRVNDHELRAPHLLSDGDRIAVDGAKLRYEYLHWGL